MYVVLKWYFQWMKLQLHGCTFLLLPIVQKYVTCPNTRGHDQVLTFCLKFCSRLFSRTTRTRATRSWLLILKPSRASLFRACWSPSCTRSTRGRSRVLLDREPAVALLHAWRITGVPVPRCGASSSEIRCSMRHLAALDNNEARCYFGLMDRML